MGMVMRDGEDDDVNEMEYDGIERNCWLYIAGNLKCIHAAVCRGDMYSCTPHQGSVVRTYH
jgi:hypothetical protein